MSTFLSTNAKKEDISEIAEKQITQGDKIPSLIADDLDVYPLSVNYAQFESLIILLSTRSRMTTKAIQRAIEYANIFAFLNNILAEVRSKATKEYEKIERQHPLVKELVKQKKEHPLNIAYLEARIKTDAIIESEMRAIKDKIINDVTDEHKIKNLLLGVEIAYYISDFIPVNPFFFADEDRIKTFMLTKDKYGTAEKKRAGVISEIRRVSNLNIPSYNVIYSGLEELEQHGYVISVSADKLKEKEKLRAGAKGLWYLSPEFVALWDKKRKALLDEYDELSKKLDSITVLYELNERVGTRLLDFYLIKVRERRVIPSLISSKYLAFQEEVSLVLRD